MHGRPRHKCHIKFIGDTIADDKFAKEINFNKVLFFHMNRTAMSQQQSEMDANVDIFESLLFPYIDDKYKTEKVKADKKLKNAQMIGNETAEADYTKTKFRALMALAERKNLLLEKTDRDEEWNLEEENATDTTEDVAEAAPAD